MGSIVLLYLLTFLQPLHDSFHLSTAFYKRLGLGFLDAEKVKSILDSGYFALGLNLTALFLIKYDCYMRAIGLKKEELPLQVKTLNEFFFVIIFGFIVGVLTLIILFHFGVLFLQKAVWGRFVDMSQYRPYDTLMGRSRRELAAIRKGEDGPDP